MNTKITDVLHQARAVWRRRKWLGLYFLLLSFCTVATFVMSLPKVYRATATVLVERQQIPETEVKSTMTSEVGTRLSVISQEVLSRSRLEAVIRDLDLYRESRARLSPDMVVRQMWRDIDIGMASAHGGGRGQGGTTVFSLSYQGRDPAKVAAVTNALASLYVERNLRVRNRQAAETATRLQSQLDETQRRLEAQERQVADVTARYSEEPGQDTWPNLGIREWLNSELRVNRANQKRLLERRDFFLRQRVRDSAGAPTEGATAEAPVAELARLKRELSELLTRFTDKYPDVIRLKGEIASLERDLAERGPTSPSDPSAPRGGTAERGGALEGSHAELQALKQEEGRLREAILQYQRRVANVPRREQELQKLPRDYEATKELYRTLLKRYQEAALATIEEGRQGERFRVLDTALVPREPIAPKRLRLMAIGLALALGLGVGAMLVAEQLDRSVHTAAELRRLTSIPVFSIPILVTGSGRREQRRRMSLGAGLVALVCYVLV